MTELFARVRPGANEIVEVSGKKLHDKRERTKRREADRESRAAIKAGRTR